MAGVQLSALAAAVSNAGALGSLPCAMLTPEGMRKELAALKAATNKPFNVNFFCHTPPAPDEARERAWRGKLAPYYREYGIDPAKIPAGPGRAPFSDEAADLLDEFEPAVVSFHFGLPSRELLARARRAGAKILSSATTVEEARWLEAQRRGRDHRAGRRSRRASRHLPVERPHHAARHVRAAAAGGARREGAGDRGRRHRGREGRGGGDGARRGRRAGRHRLPALPRGDHQRRAPRRAQERGARATPRSPTSSPAGRRAASSIASCASSAPINGAAPAFPLASAAIAPLRAKAEAQGSGDFSPLWSGQNASGCREIPAADLTRELARPFRQ